MKGIAESLHALVAVADECLDSIGNPRACRGVLSHPFLYGRPLAAARAARRGSSWFQPGDDLAALLDLDGFAGSEAFGCSRRQGGQLYAFHKRIVATKSGVCKGLPGAYPALGLATNGTKTDLDCLLGATRQ